ncbi:MAG: translesion DNA synthesis-associated protein ImuA [Betaproteobacteria bacterium]|nr:translesion DNA synthesis-associated protein ImuA [Betaproteobacteria bacterium]
MNAIVDPAKLPGVWRAGEVDRAVPAGIASGHARLDRELPGGGWPRASLIEILHDGAGLGEVSLLFGALRTVAEEGRAVAWINPPHLPYAPALACAGVPLDACLVVRPASAEDALWSADQTLRSGACGAALFWLPEKTDYAWLRRLQMAAESGRTLAVLFRPASASMIATPAHLRVLVTSQDGQLLVSLPKRRGPPLLRPIAIRLTGRPARNGDGFRRIGDRFGSSTGGTEPVSILSARVSV